MMKRRAVVVEIIRVLLLATLLLGGISVMPREHIDSRLEKNRASLVGAAYASAAQVSGDGLIAFSADEQIYVMNADGSNITLLTDGAPGALYRYPALSPDGTRLAFIRDDDLNNHALYVMNIDGSGARWITDSPVALSEPAWSPDGTRLAFVRGYDTTHGGYANITSCGQTIYVIDLATSIQLSLTQGTDPTWSPDGTRIAFSSARDGNYEIYTINSDGCDIQQLTRSTEFAEAEPSWSPDGKQIAYTAHLLQGAFLCGFMPTPRPPSAADEAPTGIYVMNADGSDQTMLERTVGGIEPAWSPDGTTLALVINGKGGWQVYTTDAEGMSLTKLTRELTQKSSPSWSRASKPIR